MIEKLKSKKRMSIMDQLRKQGSPSPMNPSPDAAAMQLPDESDQDEELPPSPNKPKYPPTEEDYTSEVPVYQASASKKQKNRIRRV